MAMPERRRLPVRRAALIGALAAGLVGTVVLPPRPRLVWNVSASAPVGLYWVSPTGTVAAGDLVIAWVPAHARGLAASRRYIPINVPLVKRAAGVPGDTICAADGHIFVNGRWAAWQRRMDGRGRPMPTWHGCATLAAGQLFLLMDTPGSFDGRYFGPTERGDIVGRARPLWTR
jgi:conjugative transfer signal peptidase TraF